MREKKQILANPYEDDDRYKMVRNPILERGSAVLLLLLLPLLLRHAQGTPLDSETGWTGELWSNCILLIFEN